jgi:hypothetical protein
VTRRPPEIGIDGATPEIHAPEPVGFREGSRVARTTHTCVFAGSHPRLHRSARPHGIRLCEAFVQGPRSVTSTAPCARLVWKGPGREDP